MNRSTHPAIAATPARKRKSHGPAPKPRGIVAGTRRGARITSQRAEGLLMQLVGRLAADANANPQARSAHGYFVNGCLAMLEALGAVPRARLHIIRTACDQLLDGNLTVQDLKAMKATGSDTDPTYLQAVSLVRRAGTAEDRRLSAEMDIGLPTARALIERMQVEGILNPPDMFGVRTLRLAEEVRS